MSKISYHIFFQAGSQSLTLSQVFFMLTFQTILQDTEQNNRAYLPLQKTCILSYRVPFLNAFVRVRFARVRVVSFRFVATSFVVVAPLTWDPVTI